MLQTHENSRSALTAMNCRLVKKTCCYLSQLVIKWFENQDIWKLEKECLENNKIYVMLLYYVF